MSTDDLEYVPVGTDRWRAHLVAEACRAVGIPVQLLTSDASGVDPALALMQSHRLLVRRTDLDRVRTVIAGF